METGYINEPILVVDDDSQMRVALKEAIHRLGYGSVVTCDSGEDALRKMDQTGFSMVVTDMKMPKMDGLAFIREARKRIGNLPVLVITGFGTIENAVETMKEGAADYLIKPFSIDNLQKAISLVMTKINHQKEILTEDPEMKKVVNIAAGLASGDITLLIYGESGTGKELVARYIHRVSRRADRPLVAVNCAAIPDNLLESEMFGHEKGAFTGAAERKIGKFELANSGTILLDEIGEMPVILQAKLLRVLQEKEVDRLGGKNPVPVDVRVIATTNRDLRKECMEGRFREDLYYRLSVFPIKIPPLRERPEDIVLLTSYFIDKYSGIAGKEIRNATEDALTVLKNAEWRGNVRELENVIQRAVFLCSGSALSPEDLMLENTPLSSSGTARSCRGRIRDMEKELILQTLKNVNGNKTKAAKMLGITVRTIRNKLNEYGKNFPEA